jgi:gluconolactonase
MTSEPILIAEHIPFAEGPVWCDDGTLVVTSVAEGALYRIWPETRRKAKIADTKGGANSAWPASDGGFLVTQNGGIDFAAVFPAYAEKFAEQLPKVRFAEPGLQRVAPDGAVSYLIEGMQAPNDLVVGADGTVFFTDPPRISPPSGTPGRVMAWRPDGTLEEVAGGFSYCNGIALEPDGGLVVVEGAGLMRVHPGGRKEWILEQVGESPSVDGFCLDDAGRFWMAAGRFNGVRVVEGGKVVEFLEAPGEGLTTNCCFGGAHGRAMFMTNGVPGNVWMWEDVGARGLGLNRWPVR